ncbi:DNA adenine methylase [Mesonia mobilis]|uniref:site-specific DNA-methyltransferase (adenine-specific) n=1 Tax=Mesonia mobilis TaxID=369791 RepID=A0ABQ3C364_9FLAO|nr:DNA adenine methylase [Mesonia mobilis]GGZ65879.1 DNA adenine methylase [Mesonia mobilis]
MNTIVEEPVVTYNQINLSFANYTKERKLEPLVKWAGGKEQELKYIIPNLPDYFENYYEPFVGGGSVYTAIQAKEYFINDKAHELIDLYKIIVSDKREMFFKAIEEIIHNWEVLGNISEKNQNFFIKIYKDFAAGKISKDILSNKIYEFILKNSKEFNGLFSSYFNFNIENFLKEIKKNLVRKTSRMKVLEKEKGKLPDKDILDNIETAFKSAFYMHFRHIYNFHKKYELNQAFYTAIFLFIRNYAYSGMFRYNSKGEFNVPYGGIAYNNKNFRKKIEYLKSEPLQELLSKTNIVNADFQDFFNLYEPTENDFIFLDPPYDTEFSTYAQNDFLKTDQKRLAEYLINNCKAKWMMIIKNTDFIFDLYNHPKVKISTFDKTYLVSFMNRNDKNVEHLLITNY